MDSTAQTERLPNLPSSDLFNDIKMPTFRRIGLMGRAGKRSVTKTLIQIANAIDQMGLDIVMGDNTANLPTLDFSELPANTQVVKRSLLGEVCDLAIVVGGDGSILHAASSLARYQVPVLGVNRGRLGFLADVSPDEVVDRLHTVLMGDYQLDYRFLLMMEVRNGNDILYQDMALNDVVLHAGKSVHMIDFQMQIDGQNVYRQHSDGLIVSTPTGSTAYALSGGGPIVHPSLDAICLVPMHPHTLSSRPIVVSGSSEIMLRIHPDNRTQPMVSADGKTSLPLNQNQRLYIRKHPERLTLLHPPGYDFYEACRTKLNWNVHAEEFSLSMNADLDDEL